MYVEIEEYSNELVFVTNHLPLTGGGNFSALIKIINLNLLSIMKSLPHVVLISVTITYM